MTDTTSIPLNKLVAWDGNVRKTAGTDTALAELAASIAAHGLLNNLLVRKERKGKHAVVAGGRRLAALQLLAEEGRIAKDHPVLCQLRDDGSDQNSVSSKIPCANKCIPSTNSRLSAISSTTACPRPISLHVSASATGLFCNA
jgi:hypothetical protein